MNVTVSYIFFYFFFLLIILLALQANNYPSILTKQPVDRVNRCFPVNQPNKARRAQFTIYAIQKLISWYGSIPNFLVCLDELKAFTESAEKDSEFYFKFPDDLKNLAVTREAVLKEMKDNIRPSCSSLLTLGRFTRTQFNLLCKFIPHLPAWKTVNETGRSKKKYS